MPEDWEVIRAKKGTIKPTMTTSASPPSWPLDHSIKGWNRLLVSFLRDLGFTDLHKKICRTSQTNGIATAKHYLVPRLLFPDSLWLQFQSQLLCGLYDQHHRIVPDQMESCRSGPTKWEQHIVTPIEMNLGLNHPVEARSPMRQIDPRSHEGKI